jgi:hypothetical protein
MTATDHVTPPPEELVSDGALAVGGALRAGEVALALFVGLLVCPPLLILAAVVVLPLAALTIVASLIGAVVAAPFLLVRHVRDHHRTHRTSVVAHRLGQLRAPGLSR